MSVADKINSIKTHVADAYTGISNKGGTIPNNKNIENLKAAIETISSGAELNIHYGDTAPEDTSKLWVKTTEPDSVEISPDFGYGEAIQTTGVASGFPTGTVCVDGDYLYAVSENYIKKYNKNTFTFISNIVSISNKNIYSILVHNGILYYMEDVYTHSGFNYYYRAKLYAYDLTTKKETVLKSDYKRDRARLQLYNDKLYIIGGGYMDNDSYPDVSGCDIYDISKNTWETWKNYSLGGCLYGCVIIGNNAFKFGGRDFKGNTIYNSIYRINLDTKTVTKCNAILPIATYDMGVSHLGNYIYLSGGNKTSQIVYRYDTVNDTIEQVNVTLEHARTICATFFNGTELYLSGSNSIVDKLQIDVPLSSTKLKIISDWLNNQFAVVNSSSAKVMIGVNKAFKGDENNKAKEVTAYVFDGVNWHNLNGEITFTKLYAPKISISGKTLTITNDGRNGSKVTNYKVYNGSTLLTTITATTLDLTTVIITNGTYNISVIATGTGYTDSDNSNIVEYNYAVYNITTNLTGVTANASNPTTVSTLASSTLTFTASTGYNLPDNVTVTGAEYTWTKSSGTLVLSNPTGAVSVTVAGVAISRTITATLTNVTAASDNATTIATGETKTLTYTAADGYVLPDTVTVTGATGVWNKDAGTLTLSNPTGNVTFTIAGVEAVTGYTDCLTFTGKTSDFTLKATNGKVWDGTLEWSTDHNTWTTLAGMEEMQSVDKKLYLRGKGNTVFYDSKSYNSVEWRLSAEADCIGNIQTLLDYEIKPTSISKDYCYSEMFKGCTNLTSAPELPATTLAEGCYEGMFKGCTHLTAAPELPATTLAARCYFNMFLSCTSLTSASELPATTLAEYCYYNMFKGCTSLTAAPKLLATTLALACCYSMFEGCTSLTNCAELLATTLVKSCYPYMFDGCVNLKVNSVSGTKIFTCPSTIPDVAVNDMFNGTGGTFTGTPTAGNTYYYTV